MPLCLVEDAHILTNVFHTDRERAPLGEPPSASWLAHVRTFNGLTCYDLRWTLFATGARSPFGTTIQKLRMAFVNMRIRQQKEDYVAAHHVSSLAELNFAAITNAHFFVASRCNFWKDLSNNKHAGRLNTRPICCTSIFN